MRFFLAAFAISLASRLPAAETVVRGRVIHGDTRNPVPGLRLNFAEQVGLGKDPEFGEAIAGDNGAFEIRLSSVASFKVRVRNPDPDPSDHVFMASDYVSGGHFDPMPKGYLVLPAPLLVDLRKASAGRLELGDIEVIPSPPVTVRIVGNPGRPIPGLLIAFEDARDGDLLGATNQAGEVSVSLPSFEPNRTERARIIFPRASYVSHEGFFAVRLEDAKQYGRPHASWPDDPPQASFVRRRGRETRVEIVWPQTKKECSIIGKVVHGDRGDAAGSIRLHVEADPLGREFMGNYAPTDSASGRMYYTGEADERKRYEREGPWTVGEPGAATLYFCDVELSSGAFTLDHFQLGYGVTVTIESLDSERGGSCFERISMDKPQVDRTFILRKQSF